MYDEYLIRIARQTACASQIILQRIAQALFPFGVAVSVARLTLDQFGTVGALPTLLVLVSLRVVVKG